MTEHATKAQSRLRRPFARLRDLPIWSKLGVIMIVPTLATIVVGTNGLIGHIDTYGNADRTQDLASLSVHAGDLVHHLQDERAAAVLVLGAGAENELDERMARYSQIQESTNEAETAYQNRRTRLTDLTPGFRSLLGDVGGRLADLPQLRNRVTAGELGLTEAARSYEELINGLINLRESSAQLSGEVELGDRMRAAAGIARAKEFLSRQRVIGHETLIRDAFHPQLRTAFIGTQTGQEQALEQFDSVATDEERALLEQRLEGPDVRQSGNYQDYLDSLEGEDLGTPPWDAEGWDQVMSAHADLLRQVESHLDNEVVGEAVALREAVTQRMLVETGALLAVLLVAILLAWLVARTMARSLRELRQGALSVAQYGLPQAVARLRDPSLSTQMSPMQAASHIAEPLPVHSKDEFGQVTEAFNAVHLEAVRTAAEQASLRASVATMFVNLARRSQILVDRLIGHLDRLERGEEDPDRLAELFQLDHLATRMRRNDENLLVLAGADSTRVQRSPASLTDVLRAAQSEVEHYTRIEFGVVDRDIEVAAHAVNDLVHLVAELLDNATAFSPPDSYVTVEARRVGDRAVLYVEDQGLGLSAEQLADINERLATPPLVDVAVSRMMGLVVVARLAARHGVKVELRRGPERGTIADVSIPAQVLVPRAAGGPAPEGQLPGRQVPSVSGPVPLALESGLSRAPASPPSSPPSAPPPSSPPPSFPPPAQTSAPPGPASAPPGPASAPPGPASAPPAGLAPSDPPEDGSVSGPPSRSGRRVPLWSDLTGASGNNGAEPPAESAAAPLPRRQPGRSQETDDSTSPIPRQRPAGEQDPSTTQGAAQPAVDSTEDASGTSHAPAPPAWPPLAQPSAAEEPQPTPAERAGPAPAAGPMAGEQDDRRGAERAGSPGSTERAGAGAEAKPYSPPAQQPVPVADATMELPIFSQLESAWFRTTSERAQSRSQAVPDGEPAEAATAEYAAVGASESTTGDAVMGDGARRVPDGAAAATGGDAGADWRTVADDGWRAAASLTDTAVAETTEAGLPKRRPMAQLVPGGVDTAAASPQRRSPEAVRGLLSAYHRGVQRGRTQSTTDDLSHSAQAGKEQGA